MCAVKSPKVKQEAQKPPKPTIIRNPYLDGIDPKMRAAREGRTALRIDRELPASMYLSKPKVAPIG